MVIEKYTMCLFQIDGKEPRYRILLEGAALQIISLYKTDAGIYLCSADNNIGKPLKKEIRLEVIGNFPRFVILVFILDFCRLLS